MSDVNAGEYSQLHIRLASEFRISAEDLRHFDDRIDQIVLRCGKQNTDSFEGKTKCMRNAIYNGRQLQSDSSSSAIADYFPHHLLQEGKGTVSAYSFLTLILAERLGLRCTPVMLPDYTYIRFSSGSNWDILDSGKNIREEEYRKRYMLDPGTGRVAKSIAVPEYEGWIRFQIGSFLDRRGDFPLAETQLRIASAQWADTHVPVQLALVLEKQDQRKTGLLLLDSLWNWGAHSEELVWNRAMMMVRIGKRSTEVLQFLDVAQGRLVQSKRLVQLREMLEEGIFAQ
jgi:hypothetical protein